MPSKSAILSAAVVSWALACFYLLMRTYEHPIADRMELLPAAGSLLLSALLYASAVLVLGSRVGVGILAAALTAGATLGTLLFQLSYEPLHELAFNWTPDPSTWSAIFLAHSVPIEGAKFVPIAMIAVWLSRAKQGAPVYFLAAALVGLGFALAELTPLYARAVSDASWLRSLGPDRLFYDDLWHRGIQSLAMPAFAALAVSGFAATARSDSFALKACAGLLGFVAAVVVHAIVYAYYPIGLVSSGRASMLDLLEASMRSGLPNAFWMTFTLAIVANVLIVGGVLYATRDRRGG